MPLVASIARMRWIGDAIAAAARRTGSQVLRWMRRLRPHTHSCAGFVPRVGRLDDANRPKSRGCAAFALRSARTLASKRRTGRFNDPRLGARDTADRFEANGKVDYSMRATIALCLLCACNGTSSTASTEADASGEVADDAAASVDATPSRIRTIFVIPFENKANAQIYGNTTDAPYINNLIATIAAHATMFGDELPTLPSEPHYIWMEAGTNEFSDRTFTGDGDPSMTNSTGNTAHLVTTLTAAGIPWMSYQEGITSHTCPVATSGQYAPKHDPFVFFRDVAGSPPSASARGVREPPQVVRRLRDGSRERRHGLRLHHPGPLPRHARCARRARRESPTAPNIKAGDTWLSTELPRIIAYTESHPRCRDLPDLG